MSADHPRFRSFTNQEYTKLADFRFALRTFLDFSAKEAADHGMTAQQHQALLVIRGSAEQSASVGRLAERLCLRPNSAAELAQRLEHAGLVSRERDEADQRTVWLKLTDVGHAKLDALTLVHRRELKQIGPQIIEFFQQLTEK